MSQLAVGEHSKGSYGLWEVHQGHRVTHIPTVNHHEPTLSRSMLILRLITVKYQQSCIPDTNPRHRECIRDSPSEPLKPGFLGISLIATSTPSALLKMLHMASLQWSLQESSPSLFSDDWSWSMPFKNVG